MKNVIAASILTLTAFSSFAANAAEIRGAVLNASKTSIMVDVRYGGGCKEHKFKLELGECRESYPVSCDAQLVDLTDDDFCEAMISKTIEISLRKEGLNTRYYAGGSLTIEGDNDTKATVRLPR